MDNKTKLLHEQLDNAIDSMNMDSIENILNEIYQDESLNVEIEDYKDFSEKIKGNYRREKNNMKLFKNKKARVTILAATISLIACVSVGAAILNNNFTFTKDGNYWNIKSNSDIDEEEAKKIADSSDMGKKDAINAAEESGETNVIEPEYVQYESIEGAEKGLDMNIIMPDYMPELEMSDITASITDFGGTISKTAWINYGNADDKYFGLTINRTVLNDKDSTVISKNEYDEGTEGEYISKKGYSFVTLQESNEDKSKTANIAVTEIGEYEYSMVFFGFDENEMHSVIDSVDLEDYK